MDYENFKERFVEDLKDKLYEKGIEADVTVNTVNKLNDSYEAVTIKPVDDQIGVNISINKCFEAYEHGTDYNDTVDKTAKIVADSLANKPEVDVETLSDYDKMKDKLVMEVVSAETNKDLLETVPHKDIEDKDIVAEVNEVYGKSLPVFPIEIPLSIRAAETSAISKSIFEYDPKGKVAAAYAALTDVVIRNS